MGFSMAGQLARAGYVVLISDPVAARCEQWREQYGEQAVANVADTDNVANTADVIIICVTDHHADAALLLGPSGLLGNAQAGQLFIDHTTTSPQFARASARLARARRALWVDAPISGSALGAQTNTLSTFVGGSIDAVRMARPILAIYSNCVTHLGEAGCGQAGKLANQLAIAGTVRGLAEAVVLARANEVPLPALFDALCAGSAHSRQLDQHRDKLIASEFEFSKAFDWLYKDLELARAAVVKSMPLADLISSQLATVDSVHNIHSIHNGSDGAGGAP